MKAEIIDEYEVKLDNKKRMTIRKSKYNYFKVKILDNGAYLLEPRILVSPEYISKRTLKMMDESVNNLKAGQVSEKIDFGKYLK